MLFDAVALMPGSQGLDQLANHGPVRDFINDAFAHCKFIGFNESARTLFKAVGIEQNWMTAAYYWMPTKQTMLRLISLRSVGARVIGPEKEPSIKCRFQET